MPSTDTDGFTLLEVLLVVGMLGITAAIAAPGLTRARLSGTEASAIATLRAINSAQSTYASSCGGGSYAPSLAMLGTAPVVGGGEAFVAPDLDTDPSFKSGYTIALTAGSLAAGSPASCNGVVAGGSATTYFVGGAPADGIDGRYFGTNQGGTVYEDTSAVAVTQIGAPMGATPVQ